MFTNCINNVEISKIYMNWKWNVSVPLFLYDILKEKERTNPKTVKLKILSLLITVKLGQNKYSC